MGGGAYSTDKKDFDKTLDLTKIKPYGDTMNDGKVQVSFTLPIKNDKKAVESAKKLAKKMGLNDPHVVHHGSLDKNFTFFVIYGSIKHTINYNRIQINSIDIETMNMEEVNNYIKEKIKRKIVIIGATTGTDAHTVGIDAIINMKGFAGHDGLERYEMIEAHNLGSQVLNKDFIKKAIELNADILLVSQTVTQKDVHIKNLSELAKLLEIEGIRDDVILVCGGPRITNELSKELGYDAGFGPGTFADEVATFVVKELVNRKEL